MKLHFLNRDINIEFKLHLMLYNGIILIKRQ
jgi:hypothetical protein